MSGRPGVGIIGRTRGSCPQSRHSGQVAATYRRWGLRCCTLEQFALWFGSSSRSGEDDFCKEAPTDFCRMAQEAGRCKRVLAGGEQRDARCAFGAAEAIGR